MSDDAAGKAPPTKEDWQELSMAGAGIALQLAMKIDTLERELVIVRTLNEGLLAKVEAIPGYAAYWRSFWGDGRKAIPHAPLTFDEWYIKQQEPQP